MRQGWCVVGAGDGDLGAERARVDGGSFAVAADGCAPFATSGSSVCVLIIVTPSHSAHLRASVRNCKPVCVCVGRV